MISKATNDLMIKKYIKDIYYKALYLYLNYYKYGLNSNKSTVYIQQNDEIIDCIILKYGKTLHLISKDESKINYKEIKNFFTENKCTMVCGVESIINSFYKEMNSEKYCKEIGYVREITTIDNSIDKDGVVKLSSDKDLLEATDLILQDPDIYNTYTREELFNQIKDRNNEKYGRNYVLKIDNRPVAHSGTGAESKDMAVINYIIVDSNYRRQGLATKLTKALCYDLIKEGKKCYLINYTDESTKLYDKIGFKVKCKYGKCYLRKDERND